MIKMVIIELPLPSSSSFPGFSGTKTGSAAGKNYTCLYATNTGSAAGGTYPLIYANGNDLAASLD